MRFAVVYLRHVHRRQRHILRDLGSYDLQRARRLRDVVVRRHVYAVCRNRYRLAEHARVVADLRTTDLIGRCHVLTCHKAAVVLFVHRFNRVLGLLILRAGIRLIRRPTGTRQCNRTLRDRQFLRASYITGVVPFARYAYLYGLAVLDLRRSNRARVGRPVCAVCAVLDLQHIAVRVRRRRRASRMRFAVVHLLHVLRIQRHVAFNARLANRQLAVLGAYRIVRLINSVILINLCDILANIDFGKFFVAAIKIGIGNRGRNDIIRITINQARYRIGLAVLCDRMRLTIIGMGSSIRGDGQGHSVIDRDDIFGFVSRDRDGLRGGIAGHIGGGIGEIERIALVRRQLFADGHGAGLVVGNLDGGAVQVMMDGVARGVELEVQLQHQRAVAGDNAGKHVVRVALIEHVLAAILRELIAVFNGNGRVRGAIITDNALVCLLRIRAVRVLIVELDGVLGVGVRRPDGVEDVRAVVVHLHLRVGGDGAGALGVGVPALEGIADAGEGVGGLGGDGLVIGEVFNHVLACAAIGFIGQGCASGTRAPLGGEGDDVPFISVIALDLVLIAGLVGGRAVRPAEEVLAIISNQLARGHEVSKAVLRVGLAIHRSGYIVLAGNIFYSEGAVLGVVGVEGDIRCDPGLGVEGLAGAVLAGTPAAPGIAFANLRHDFRLLFVQRGFNRVALRDIEFNRRTSAFDGQIDCAVIYGLVPLGIDRDVLRGHGLAGEVIGLCCCFISIPTAKDIILHAGGLGIGRIGTLVRNALFELLGDGIYRLAAAYVDDVVFVAGVVELGVVIVSAYRGTWRAIKSKAGNRVLIFHGYIIACARAGILMMQLIGDAANRCFAALTRKHLYIVVGG